MRDREREAETQAETEAGSMQGARCGTRSRDSGIMPWAKGRCSTAEPPRDSNIDILHFLANYLAHRNAILSLEMQLYILKYS